MTNFLKYFRLKLNHFLLIDCFVKLMRELIQTHSLNVRPLKNYFLKVN